jgi:xanthine dehydrogenase accessory factor
MRTLLDIDGPEPHVRVAIVEVDGSSPREAGASMSVTAIGLSGTIGGGALEHQAIARARMLLADPSTQQWLRRDEKLALGPSLGQCCGGAVRLLYERIGKAERIALDALGRAAGPGPGLMLRPLSSGTEPMLVTSRTAVGGLPTPVARAVANMLSGLRPGRPALIRDWFIEPAGQARSHLYLYGAGHVGRAVVHAAALAGMLDVVWVDTSSERFPVTIPGDIRVEIAADPAHTAGLAPGGCYHLVMTYSHAIDLAVCHALLQRDDFAFLGLIGSKSKRGRFLSRLRQAGIAAAALDRLTCPIGIDGLTGKTPGTIALAAMAQIVCEIEKRHPAAGVWRGALPA